MPAEGRSRPTAPVLVLRGLLVLGLAADAVIHLRLAGGYELAASGGIGEGTLFRIQAVLAIAAALAVLIHPSRITAALGFLVAAAALGAVLLYRYVDVPAFGPIPSMYEPVWFLEKTLSALAEAVAALAALVLVGTTSRRRSREARSAAPGGGSAPAIAETR